MNTSKINLKETINFYICGCNKIDSDDGPDGLVEDYKTVASYLKESLGDNPDAVEFSVQTSNLRFPGVTLPECAKVLNEEIQIMMDTIKTVLIIPDKTIEQIKKTVTEYGEKYKDSAKMHGVKNKYSVGIEVEMQTVEGDYDDDTDIEVTIKAFKDYEDTDLTFEEENSIKEKTIYFEMIACK